MRITQSRSASLSRSRNEPRRTEVVTSRNMLPLISLIVACGLVVSAAADMFGWENITVAYPLFWVGLCIVALPPSVRLVMQHASRQERIGLSVVLGVGLYLVRYLQYPTSVAFFDEFLHIRTAQDITLTHHLFTLNPMLPISSLYPGLEIVTTAISSVTGLPIFVSAQFVVCISRVLVVLAIFMLIETLTKSARLAGVAVVVYACNPHFLFFDANFAYETLALALAMFSFAVIHMWSVTPRTLYLSLLALATLGIGATVLTHHITSYFLVGVLLAWTIAYYVVKRLRERELPSRDRSPVPLLAIAIALTGAWFAVTSHLLAGYLLPVFSNGFAQFSALLTGDAPPRTLFTDYAGSVEPAWERFSALASSGLATALALVGAWATWTRFRRNSLLLALSGCALLLPITLVLVFAPATAEFSERSSEFVYLPVAAAIGVGVRFMWVKWQTRVRAAALVLGVLILFVGGINTGSGPDWERIPGPYMVSAESHSINQESINAAQWMSTYVGDNNRTGADRFNGLLLGTYGRQHLVTTSSDGVTISPVYFDPVFGPSDVQLLERSKVQYLLVDMRLATQLPREGIYFESNEPGAFHHTALLPATVLTKFDVVPGINRVFDSGDIRLYNVSELSGG